MARGRNIKPGFFSNEELCECDPLARILFVGLWCYADRSGRLEYRPKRLKAHILPYDDTSIIHLIEQLSVHGFITVYEVGGRHKYIQINNFHKHQHPHVKEPASTIPAPDSPGAKTSDSLNPITETLNPITEVRMSASADDTRSGGYSQDFQEFWEIFPRLRRTAKGRAWRAWRVAVHKASPETIIAAAKEYAASEAGRGQFVQMPSTWLNGECWQDDRQAWNPSTREKTQRILTDDELATWNPSGGTT